MQTFECHTSVLTGKLLLQRKRHNEVHRMTCLLVSVSAKCTGP